MSELFRVEDGRLVCQLYGEIVQVEAWGANALRVRSRPGRAILEPSISALLEPPPSSAEIEVDGGRARVRQGAITAEVTVVPRYGSEPKSELTLRFLRTDTGEELLAEARSHFAGPGTRNFKGVATDDYRLEATFRAYDDEHLYGLGQAQHGHLNLKGVSTTLLQQNTHVAIPFIVSSRGYGFLWHNPAVGRAEFAKNITRWTAEQTSQLDYWIVAGDSPAAILSAYADATGHAPDFPEWATGFWQCKLRYRTQDELLEVAREYKRRNLPLACIVIDFFHWTRQGEWKFDPAAWPDPAGLVRELESMGVKTMVSIWPTVAAASETFQHMKEQGYLVRAERGLPVFIPFVDANPLGPTQMAYYDPTLPEARRFVWERAKDNYLAYGINNFWLDACEPEMRPAHPENARYHLGAGAAVQNAYPFLHQQGFWEGLTEAGAEKDAVLLCRSAWAGSQRFGTILWSGDVWSRWDDFRAQIRAGLNAGMSGIGWWTTDIGGFYDGIGKDPGFRELLVRWFEFGVFSPLCRLHGFRIPDELPLPAHGVPTYGKDTQAVFTSTGGANEVWSYGDELYEVFTHLLAVRERLRPYIMEQTRRYSATGAPIMRPLFFDFPDDPGVRDVDDCYMLGPDLLIALVQEAGVQSRKVYLPGGAQWTNAWTGKPMAGSGSIEVEAPYGRPPVFIRDGAAVRVAA